MAKKKINSRLAEWQEKAYRYGGECYKCKVIVRKLTVDHIVPAHFIKTLDSTGELVYEWEDNFEMLCSACNSLKANMLDKTHPKTLELLKVLVKQLESEHKIGDKEGIR